MWWLWLGFFALIAFFLALDLGVFHRRDHAIGLREAVLWSAVWIGVGLGFSLAVYWIYRDPVLAERLLASDRFAAHGGGAAVMRYLTAYVLEKSLSIDNIFVMSVIFTSFHIPARYQHRVLFWGIIGAVVFRLAFIFGGVFLVTRFGWIFYVFGGWLLLSGFRLLLSRDAEPDPQKSWIIRQVRKVIPLTTMDHGPRFTARENGRFVFTGLALALVTIEVTDVVFAADSIPAVLAITTDSFVVATSNIFAILGLRSLYFVLAGMIDKFRHLSAALSLVLIFIGAKMVFHNWIHVPNWFSLVVILALVGGGIGLSLWLPDGRQSTPS